MKRLLLAFLLSITFYFSHAQLNTLTSADIYLNLRKLNVLGSVLYVAAHPDDENTRLLTYFSKERLYRTGYLSLTRGDGGQNLIGDEQGIALGLIRTQELLAARRIDGAEQYFTRAYDFGFSKNPEETFTKWDREKILADVVWTIRKLQPDVIITRFPSTGEGGHGHHTASAILANEAFTAAADAKRFPEQLKWVQPWQATRILWNTFNFGGNTNTTKDDQYRLDAGGYNAVLGKSYGEISAESRSQHKSQGFGVPLGRGEAWEYFTKTGGRDFTTGLFDDITLTWKRVKGGEKIAGLIENAITTFDFVAPQKSVPQLVTIYKTLKTLPDSYWKDQKLKETQSLIEAAGGLWLEAYTSEQYVAQTDSVRINFWLNNRLGADAVINKVTINTKDTVLNTALLKNKNLIFGKSIYVASNKSITQPYWLQNKMEEGYFNVADQNMIGIADVQPAYEALFEITIQGQPFTFTRPVKYKYTDAVRGEVQQPLTILPPLTVYTQPPLLLFKKDTVTIQNSVTRVVANKNISFKNVDAALSSHNTLLKSRDTGKTFTKGIAKEYNYVIKRNVVKDKSVALVPKISVDNGLEASSALTTIKYDHIPSINYFSVDTIKVLNIDIATAGKKVGYITGAGDKLPQALVSMGYEVTLLTDKELARTNLQYFDAIITGVRAYNTKEWIHTYYNKLMQYVSNGGNLIVQYNRNNQQGLGKSRIGPYDFKIANIRVTDENAPVLFLKKDHPVLNYPNKITNKDFEGWVQERSIYHAADYDKSFEAILSMSDKGEAPQEGSLIIAKHGKGFFTYTGLVFFRELPAGVPGAYRLLANLIALNKKNEF